MQLSTTRYVHAYHILRVPTAPQAYRTQHISTRLRPATGPQVH